MKNKIKLNDLKIRSFVTSLKKSHSETLIGGNDVLTDGHTCVTGATYCQCDTHYDGDCKHSASVDIRCVSGTQGQECLSADTQQNTMQNCTNLCQ